MITATVEVLKETSSSATENGYTLCFQYCTYHYSDGTKQRGYRFIWRRPDGSLQAARGQARIPSISILLELVSKALDEERGNQHHALQAQETAAAKTTKIISQALP